METTENKDVSIGLYFGLYAALILEERGIKFTEFQRDTIKQLCFKEIERCSDVPAEDINYIITPHVENLVEMLRKASESEA